MSLQTIIDHHVPFDWGLSGHQTVPLEAADLKI